MALLADRDTSKILWSNWEPSLPATWAAARAREAAPTEEASAAGLRPAEAVSSMGTAAPMGQPLAKAAEKVVGVGAVVAAVAVEEEDMVEAAAHQGSKS